MNMDSWFMHFTANLTMSCELYGSVLNLWATKIKNQVGLFKVANVQVVLNKSHLKQDFFHIGE